MLELLQNQLRNLAISRTPVTSPAATSPILRSWVFHTITSNQRHNTLAQSRLYATNTKNSAAGGKQSQNADSNSTKPSISLLPKPAGELPVVPKHRTILGRVNKDHIERYDHDDRTRLFSRSNKDRIQTGSILQVEMLTSLSRGTTQTVIGLLMGVNRRGLSTTFYLRTMILKTGVDLILPLYSPMLRSIKVVRAAKKDEYHRAKLYYLKRQSLTTDKREKVRAARRNRAKIFEKFETMKKI